METPSVGYSKTYKMRKTLSGKKYISVTMPYEIIQRQSALNNMSVEQFMEFFVVVAEYNDSDEVRYTFKDTRGGGNNG
jgi:hypothetical protein